MNKIATIPIYGKNPTKIFSKTGGNQIWLEALMAKFYNVYINHDPVMTLTYFKARLTWVAYAFEWGKLLKCHLKGKTCRKLANGQNILLF